MFEFVSALVLVAVALPLQNQSQLPSIFSLLTEGLQLTTMMKRDERVTSKVSLEDISSIFFKIDVLVNLHLVLC